MSVVVSPMSIKKMYLQLYPVLSILSKRLNACGLSLNELFEYLLLFFISRPEFSGSSAKKTEHWQKLEILRYSK